MTTHPHQETFIDYTPADNSGGKIWTMLAFVITWAVLGYGIYYLYDGLEAAQDKSKQRKDKAISVTRINELEQSWHTQNANILRKIIQNNDIINRLEESTDSIDDLQDIVLSVSSQIKPDETKADKTDIIVLSNRLDTLENKIAKMSQSLAKADVFDGTVFTLLRLHDRVRAAEDYTIELDILKRLSDSDSTMQSYLAELESLLEIGATSLTALSDEFVILTNNLTAPQIVEKETPASESESFWGSVKKSLSSNIKVSKVATQAEIDIIAHIKTALHQGDINSAIKLSGQLTGDAAQNIADWREKLKELHKTEILFDAIYQYSKKQLSKDIAPPAQKAEVSIDIDLTNVADLESSLMKAVDDSISANVSTISLP